VIAPPFALAIGWAFSMVFPISWASSATTAVLVSATIGAVVLGATWVAARRAISISPQTALRRD
jgi:ABC-type lipoprotein release transport system permease subunit